MRHRSGRLLALALGLTACGDSEEVPEITAWPDGSADSLASVRRWFYYLDVNIDDETIASFERSSYDLAVIDPIFTEANNTDFDAAAVLDRWHAAPKPKLALAYVDIGQAEDFRAYWQPGWTIGSPAWILGGDPDGWEGNYPVAFWDPEYQALWIADGGIIDAVVAAGFDGIYLDWVEAYSDTFVVEAASAQGIDPQAEMIAWVGALAERGRSAQPEFIVVGQNAAELADIGAYAAIVDGIAQEQTWFDGAADGDPEGDCPLPRFDEDIDEDAYVGSLSGACRRQWEEFPDSTLHVSTEGYLIDLERAKEQGLVVLSVDYAIEPANIAKSFNEQRARDFVPFASGRLLDTWIEPIP